MLGEILGREREEFYDNTLHKEGKKERKSKQQTKTT